MTPRLASSAPVTLVRIDTASGQPLYRQIYESIRDAILDGRLRGGVQLPATRVLARELAVSRQTVVAAVDQLRAEGYLESRERSGLFVSSTLPDHLLRTHATRVAQGKTRVAARGLSHVTASGAAARPFRTGLPATDAFPWRLWARLLARYTRRAGPSLAGYDHPTGYAPLREAIATYVSAARGVTCSADQVLITSGAQQALVLVARTLVNPGARIWVENPGYLGARRAFADAGGTLVPIAIDAQGLSVLEGREHAARAHLAYVTPSHQYPLGITMSAGRRLELLAWARRAHAWILEDDYNSEFRYASRPLASLQGLDGGERVIYVGTFSKTLFPSLRLGYAVLPPALLDVFLQRTYMMARPPTLEQAVLAEFLAEGHFTRHVRRMRVLYQERRDALLHALERYAAGLLEPGPADAGMHLVGWLPAGVPDTAISARAAEVGLEAMPVSHYWISPAAGTRCRPGLLLGFAGFKASALSAAVERLASIVRSVAPRGPKGRRSVARASRPSRSP